MTRPRHRVSLTDTAAEMLRSAGKRYGKKTYQVLRDLIADLEVDPDQKGQALRHPLQGFYSLHYSRFRVIYRIEHRRAVVVVVAVGHHASGERDGIYRVLQRMVEAGQIQVRPQ